MHPYRHFICMDHLYEICIYRAFLKKKFRYIIGETVCAVRTSEMGGPPSLTPPKGTTITGWARVLPPPLLERQNRRLRLHILSLSESLPAKKICRYYIFLGFREFAKKNREGVVTCQILAFSANPCLELFLCGKLNFARDIRHLRD